MPQRVFNAGIDAALQSRCVGRDLRTRHLRGVAFGIVHWQITSLNPPGMSGDLTGWVAGLGEAGPVSVVGFL